MKSLRTKRVLFLGNQDGVGELELKSRLSMCFSSGSEIELAYLARVSFVELPGPHVALCVKGDETSAMSVVERVGEVFSKLFKTTEHLDILFLTDSQVIEIAAVAVPFYTASSKQSSS